MQFARFLGLGTTSRTTYGQHLFLGEFPGFHREMMKHPELVKCSILIIFNTLAMRQFLWGPPGKFCHL